MLTGLAASTTDSVAAGSMKAICTNGSGSPTFTFSSANGSGTDFRLIGSTDATVFIKYSLHPDTSGAASAFSHSVAAAYPGFSPDGTLKTLDLAGKILAAEKAGKKIQAYTDTITVTTSF
jgi:spore coat protein U-like protein